MADPRTILANPQDYPSSVVRNAQKQLLTINKNNRPNKLRQGFKTLGGGRWKSIFGASNYQKLMRSYKGKYIQTRKGADGKSFLYDTRTKSKTNEEGIANSLVQHITGSETPFEDLKYLNIKGRELAVQNLGKGNTARDLNYNIRRQFSSDLYNSEGLKIGKEYDLKREAKLNQLKIASENASLGTSYDYFQPGGQKYIGSKEVGRQVDGINQNQNTSKKVIENDKNNVQIKTEVKTDGSGNSTEQVVPPTKEEIKINKKNSDKLTTPPPKEDNIPKKETKSKKTGMYGLTIKEWSRASAKDRRRAKRLSGNRSRAELRGKGTLREMYGFTD